MPAPGSRRAAAAGRSPRGALRTLGRPRRARVQVARGDGASGRRGDGASGRGEGERRQGRPTRGGGAGERGTPLAVDGDRVELVRETWLVEDGWWTGRPLRRRYWEVLSVSGRCIVVFHDLVSGDWFTQVG